MIEKYEDTVEGMKKWKGHINHQHLHACFKVFYHDPYPLVEKCFEDEDGKVWMGNNNDWKPANFCPYCGFKAPAPMKERIRENCYVDID